jgi:DUF4097 and DUF4098 domain-containing protein YvlB
MRDRAFSAIVLFGLVALVVAVAIDVFSTTDARTEEGAAGAGVSDRRPAEAATPRAGIAQNDLEREVEMSAGETLRVDLRPGGSIHIRGGEEERALVRFSLRGTDPDAFRFEVERMRTGVEVTSERLRRVNNVNVRVDIRVPRRCDLELRTAGGGITIRDIEGSIGGRTAGGELTLEDLSGTIELSTGGGEITLTDSRLDGTVRTGGGKVLVENVEGDIDASSGGGEVVYRNVVTPDHTYPADAVFIRNAGGSIRVDDAPAGADVRTGGGNIRIRSAASYAKARTGGGDIRIDAIDGWAEASTGAGSIEVTMIGETGDGRRDVTLESGLGDIYLTLPAEISARFEIELAYTRNSSQRFEIDSDFDLLEERTDTWDSSQGDPRKYIRGTATVGGGRNLIRVRTTNGDVHLRKRQ